MGHGYDGDQTVRETEPISRYYYSYVAEADYDRVLRLRKGEEEAYNHQTRVHEYVRYRNRYAHNGRDTH